MIKKVVKIKSKHNKIMACKKCGGETSGFKCDMCGVEAATHDDAHVCGGEHCMPKCVGCSEAEAKCACA